MNPEQELEQLRARVRELEVAEPSRERNEIVRDAIREHAESPAPVPPPDYRVEVGVDSPHKNQIVDLLREVESRGISATMHMVTKLHPHLVDDFHDALVQYLRERHGV